MHQLPGNPKEKEHLLRIRKVLAYIQENLSDEVSLGKLSEIACFSPFHFQKLFSVYVGESPKQYIMRLRLERIAHYLKLYPELSINEASFQSGFSSPSAFIRAFRKYYGTTPEAFRNLTMDEISKIGTFKPNKSKSLSLEPAEFWSMDLSHEEITALASGMNVGVKTIRSLKVGFMESHLGEEEAIPNTFKALSRWAEPRGLINSETQFIGIFLDLPFFTEYEKCRFRACITLPENISLSKELGTAWIPEGRYANFELKGTLRHAFNSLVAFRHDWLEQSGYQIAEISGFEFYFENPASKPYENIQRQLFIPVKPA